MYLRNPAFDRNLFLVSKSFDRLQWKIRHIQCRNGNMWVSQWRRTFCWCLYYIDAHREGSRMHTTASRLHHSFQRTHRNPWWEFLFLPWYFRYYFQIMFWLCVGMNKEDGYFSRGQRIERLLQQPDKQEV